MKSLTYSTVKTYITAFRQFIRFYDHLKPSELSRAQIDAYILHQIKTKNITESYQNLILSALKMFYTEPRKHKNNRYIYTHITRAGWNRVQSPLDKLDI